MTLVVTSNVTNTTHTFTNTKDILAEVAEARIDAGFHYRFSVDEAAELGQDVARGCVANWKSVVFSGH